jgi:hypothetical protein
VSVCALPSCALRLLPVLIRRLTCLHVHMTAVIWPIHQCSICALYTVHTQWRAQHPPGYTAPHRTAPHRTVQYSTVQYSTVLCCTTCSLGHAMPRIRDAWAVYCHYTTELQLAFRGLKHLRLPRCAGWMRTMYICSEKHRTHCDTQCAHRHR